MLLNGLPRELAKTTGNNWKNKGSGENDDYQASAITAQLLACGILGNVTRLNLGDYVIFRVLKNFANCKF